MNPRLLVLSVIWAFLLISCKEVTFKEPQPAGVPSLEKLPPVLVGEYLPADESDGKVDTLIIEPWGYHFKDANNKDFLGRGVISDSLVVKFYQEYYFVNFKIENQWILRLVKRRSDGSLEFLAIDMQNEKGSKDKVKRLTKRMKVTEIKVEDNTYYQITPTPEQLMALIKDGFFSGTIIKKKK